jgi:hypothetical protein
MQCLIGVFRNTETISLCLSFGRLHRWLRDTPKTKTMDWAGPETMRARGVTRLGETHVLQTTYQVDTAQAYDGPRRTDILERRPDSGTRFLPKHLTGWARDVREG